MYIPAEIGQILRFSYYVFTVYVNATILVHTVFFSDSYSYDEDNNDDDGNSNTKDVEYHKNKYSFLKGF